MVAAVALQWVTRWLHDTLELRDLGTRDIWISVPWMASVVKGALQPQRDKLKEFIRTATALGKPWAEKMDGQVWCILRVLRWSVRVSSVEPRR